ncbi:phage holin family protein [Effusibacillus consociatus]|uniref:Phage holin family protein n=1 Tax=Effusibacillus consociatus TaxID=1117041 RepID=A0ABV9Q4G3_9BACL
MLKALNLDNIFKFETGVAALIGGGLGGLIEVLYGPNHLLMILILAGAIGFDWLSGTRAAKKDGTYSSEYGIDGVIRTIVMLFLPAFANLLDKAFQTPGVIFYGITLALIYHTWQSFAANSIRAGWGKWIPEFIFKSVESELQAKMNRAMQRHQSGEKGESK